jgi:hypothetical protein
MSVSVLNPAVFLDTCRGLQIRLCLQYFNDYRSPDNILTLANAKESKTINVSDDLFSKYMEASFMFIVRYQLQQ